MALLNYTTTIPVEKTLGEIMGMLVKHGATAIHAEYEHYSPVALAFVIVTEFGEREFHLPASIEKVFAVLVRQAQQGKIARRYATREQAARVGWRIVKDWLEAQLAIIEAEMVSIDEVLLAYLVTDQQGTTLYQEMVHRRLLLDESEKVRQLPQGRTS